MKCPRVKCFTARKVSCICHFLYRRDYKRKTLIKRIYPYVALGGTKNSILALRPDGKKFKILHNLLTNANNFHEKALIFVHVMCRVFAMASYGCHLKLKVLLKWLIVVLTFSRVMIYLTKACVSFLWGCFL